MARIPQDVPVGAKPTYGYPANSNQPKVWNKAQWLLFGVGIGMWAHWVIVQFLGLARAG